jgi:hypothetical protein
VETNGQRQLLDLDGAGSVHMRFLVGVEDGWRRCYESGGDGLEEGGKAWPAAFIADARRGKSRRRTTWQCTVSDGVDQ